MTMVVEREETKDEEEGEDEDKDEALTKHEEDENKEEGDMVTKVELSRVSNLMQLLKDSNSLTSSTSGTNCTYWAYTTKQHQTL